MKTLFTHAHILTMDDQVSVIYNGALGIENQLITYIGEIPSEDIIQTYDKVYRWQGKVILPGLINTHCHAAMSLLRGYADDIALKDWLEKAIWPLEARFTDESVRAGTALSVLEMVRSGTTCFLDMYDHMDKVAQVVQETGIRARLCRGVIGLCSEDVQQSKLNEAVAFAKSWHGEANGRITTMLSPHAPYTCPPKYIRQIIEQALVHQLPIHTHMSETLAEVEQNVNEYGMRPVEHLRELGFFDLPSLVAHAVHLTDEEIDVLATYDVKISHNLGSNLKLGSGIARIPDMLKKGIRPSLGTDGAASNNNLDMLEELQMVALVYKGVYQNPEVIPATLALKMATQFGAEALFLENQIGTLQVGKKADFISFGLDKPHMQPLHDICSQLVYSASREDIADVFVDGKPIVLNREYLTLDEEKIIFEANQAFKKIKPA